LTVAKRAAKKRAKVVPIHAPAAPPVHPFDREHGTDTGGLIESRDLVTGHASDAHVTAYYAIAPSILDGVVHLWLQSRPAFPINRYTFLDIGAGKGRALMTASLHPFLEAVGIELNPGLAAIARANLQRYPETASPLAPTRLIEGDVLEADLPPGPTVAFMFHPFEAPLLRRLLARVEAHYGAEAAPFDLLYVNAEHSVVLDANAAFTRLYQGLVPMSAADHIADLAEIAGQTQYGSTGDEMCGIYRLSKRQPGRDLARRAAPTTRQRSRQL
jgi:SAM-dependent methyltransferase